MIDPSTLKFDLKLKTADGVLQEAFNLKAEDVDETMNCPLLGAGSSLFDQRNALYIITFLAVIAPLVL